MKKDRAFQLISEALKAIKEQDMLEVGVVINDATVLLGTESPLDSIGFVTFVTDLEERISNETKKDLYLVLDKIEEFNVNKPQLTVAALADYLVQISEGK